MRSPGIALGAHAIHTHELLTCSGPRCAMTSVPGTGRLLANSLPSEETWPEGRIQPPFPTWDPRAGPTGTRKPRRRHPHPGRGPGDLLCTLLPWSLLGRTVTHTQEPEGRAREGALTRNGHGRNHARCFSFRRCLPQLLTGGRRGGWNDQAGRSQVSAMCVGTWPSVASD